MLIEHFIYPKLANLSYYLASTKLYYYNFISYTIVILSITILYYILYSIILLYNLSYKLYYSYTFYNYYIISYITYLISYTL